MSIDIDEITLLSTIANSDGNDPFYILGGDSFHVNYLSNLSDSSIELKPGPGLTNEFGGHTHLGWGPEWEGISLEQLIVIKKHPLYHRLDRDGQPDCKMYVFAQDGLVTEGAGMSYTL